MVYLPSIHQESGLRQADVRAYFLDNFGKLYPRLEFRGMQVLLRRAHPPHEFVLRVAWGRGGIEVDLLCTVLGDGYPQTVQHFLRSIAEAENSPLRRSAAPVLIAPYFSDAVRDQCRKAGVGYFDLTGTAGLETSQVLFEISGKVSSEIGPKRVEDPFEGKAERLVRTLLLDSEKRWHMRDLAQS